MLFTIFRKLVAYEREVLPFLKSCEDRAIIYNLMSAQENGHSLSFKQLSAYRLGSAATLRRRLSRLQKLGVIQKVACATDRRLNTYQIGKRHLRHFQHYEQATKAVSCMAVMAVSGHAQGEASMEKPAMKDVRTPEQVAERLRQICQKHGQVKSVALTCTHENGTLFAMIEMEGHASTAANALGGIVFGTHTVCVSLPLPAGFRCDKNKATGTCLKVFS